VVAVDAMGGDHAPDEVVQGALEARRLGARVVLVGCADAVEGRLQALGETLPLAPAPDVIGMDEPVTSALRRRQSSLKVAADLVAQGEADAVVSCGNSAAIYFFAYSIWGTQPGIDRPAFGGMLMTRGGPVFLLDIGANTSVKSSNLVQFAIMGDTYMRVSRGLTAPRIGLLSNGTEDSKGTKEVKEANQCLRRLADMNFVGNVEGSQIFEGVADVVVCDGFAGNVLLKGGEAVAAEIFDLLRAEVSKGLISRIAAAALRPAFRRIKRQLDYEEYGGAPVLGVNGVMVNCHGRSRAKAVTNAILLAQQMAREGLVDRIGEALYQENVQSVGTTRRIARALHLRHAD
jgi:glycerol-3-phosphate acyltransferase PlsX